MEGRWHRDYEVEQLEPYGSGIAAVREVVDAIEADVHTILTDADVIRARAEGLSTLTETGGTLTTDGAEQILYINEAPAGVFLPRVLKINTTNHTVTETIIVREYYRISPAGAWLEHEAKTYLGAIPRDEITVRLDPNRYGIKVTMRKIGGTNRAYIWEVFCEV